MDLDGPRMGLKRASAPDVAPAAARAVREEEQQPERLPARTLRRRADGEEGALVGATAARAATVPSRKRDYVTLEARSVPLPTPFTRVLSCTEQEAAKVARIAEFISTLRDRSPDRGLLMRSLTELRKVLSIHLTPPVDQVVSAGGVVPLVRLLQDASFAVQHEALWALSNIASGTSCHARAVLEGGAAPAVFDILASSAVEQRWELCDQCLWLLGNIAGDSDSELRDSLLRAGVVSSLGELYQRVPNFEWEPEGLLQVLRSLSWLMSSLCRGSPAPALEDVDCAFDYFAQVICGIDDAQILAEALWGLVYLVDGATEDADKSARGARLLSAGFPDNEEPLSPHPLLVEVVKCTRRAGDNRNPLPVPALRLLGAVVGAASPALTDAAIKAGALQAFREVLLDKHAPQQIRGYVAWALSNVAAGTAAQAQQLVNTTGVWDALCHVVQHGPSHQVRRECAWAIANLARRGSPFIQGISGHKVVTSAAAALRQEADAGLQRALLETIEAALKHGEEHAARKGLRRNAVLQLAEEAGLAAELEELQQVEDRGVSGKAVEILSTWFVMDRESEAPNGEKAESAIQGGSPLRPAAYKFGA